MIARGIEDPWFRAEALACVAWCSRQEDRKAILAEAKAASNMAKDPYKTVASSAWWVRAMIEKGDKEVPNREIEHLLEHSKEIENPVSRLEALFLLFEAVFEMDRPRRLVLRALIAACEAANSWKAGDRLREAALMIAVDHQDEAEQVIKAMPEGKYKRHALQRLAASKHAASTGDPPLRELTSFLLAVLPFAPASVGNFLGKSASFDTNPKKGRVASLAAVAFSTDRERRRESAAAQKPAGALRRLQRAPAADGPIPAHPAIPMVLLDGASAGPYYCIL